MANLTQVLDTEAFPYNIEPDGNEEALESPSPKKSLAKKPSVRDRRTSFTAMANELDKYKPDIDEYSEYSSGSSEFIYFEDEKYASSDDAKMLNSGTTKETAEIELGYRPTTESEISNLKPQSESSKLEQINENISEPVKPMQTSTSISKNDSKNAQNQIKSQGNQRPRSAQKGIGQPADITGIRPSTARPRSPKRQVAPRPPSLGRSTKHSPLQYGHTRINKSKIYSRRKKQFSVQNELNKDLETANELRANVRWAVLAIENIVGKATLQVESRKEFNDCNVSLKVSRLIQLRSILKSCDKQLLEKQATELIPIKEIQDD